MKRKILILVSMVLALTFVLCACGEEDNYSSINKMLDENYSTVELTVSTTKDGETLTSTAKTTQNGDKTTVDYVVRQFATFGETLPDSYIEEKVGKVVVSNGKIVEQNGASLIMNLETVTASFNFDVNYFISAKWTENSFSAVVSNAKGFFKDNEFDGIGTKVSATFGEFLQSLSVTYTSANGAKVELNYVFSK